MCVLITWAPARTFYVTTTRSIPRANPPGKGEGLRVFRTRSCALLLDAPPLFCASSFRATAMTSTSATSNATFTSEARPFLFVFKAGIQQPEQTTQLQQSDTSEATQGELSPASCIGSTGISSTASEESEGLSSATSSAAFMSEARPFLFVFKAGLQQPAETTQQQRSDTSVATQAELAPASCPGSTSISRTAPEEFEGSSPDLQKYRQDDGQPCCAVLCSVMAATLAVGKFQEQFAK